MNIEAQRPSRGFTLIELLVVVAIIGMLSSVVLASLNTARERARDSRRKSDLQQMARALDLYYLENFRYPQEVGCDSSRGSGAGACSGMSGTNWTTTSQIWTRLVPTYIPALPVDPINNASYYYSYEPSGNTVGPAPNGTPDYCIGVNLEGGGRYRIQQGDTAPAC